MTMTNFSDTTLDIINASIDAGIIYNTDYNTVKSNVNHALERMWYERIDCVYLGVLREYRESIFGAAEDLYGCDCCPQIHTFNNRVKKVAAIAKKSNHWLVADAIAFLEEIRPVIENMVALKGMVVKGRKPSTNPRQTPERTIENTGTCSVCARNVKLNDGRIVDHGYTIRYGFQSGNCFGVGFEPIEISTAGTVTYLANLEAYKTDQEETLPKAKAVAFANPTDRKLQGVAYNIESMIRTLDRDIKTFSDIIKNWEPKALPGTKG
jgi:hypothetical protein